MNDKDLFCMDLNQRESKYNRENVVDNRALKDYREKKFEGKKVIKDEYESKSVYYQKIDAQKKYKNNYNEHINNVDHIVSAKEVHDNAKYNHFVTEEKIREIVNDENNLAIATGKLNQSKQSFSILEYIEKHPELDDNTKKNLLEKDKQARMMIKKELNKATLEGVGKNAVEGAKAGALYKGTYSSIDNVFAIYRGEKELGEAISDTVYDTAQSIAISSCNRVMQVALEGGIDNVIDNLNDDFLKDKLNKLSKNRYTGVAIALGEELALLTSLLMAGDISFEDYQWEVVDKTVEIAIIYQIGCLTGPYGLVVSAAANYVGNKILEGIKKWIEKLDTREKREKRIRTYYAMAERVEKESKALIEILEKAENNYISDTNEILKQFRIAQKTKNKTLYNQGIDKLCQCYNIEPAFRTIGDVKSFFELSTSSFVLGDKIACDIPKK